MFKRKNIRVTEKPLILKKGFCRVAFMWKLVCFCLCILPFSILTGPRVRDFPPPSVLLGGRGALFRVSSARVPDGQPEPLHHGDKGGC